MEHRGKGLAVDNDERDDLESADTKPRSSDNEFLGKQGFKMLPALAINNS